ncbi:hypothetical protein PMIN04_008733 [Paraphaeosphaeria minitans]
MMLSSFHTLTLFMALVAAVPVPAETEPTTDDQKYPKEKGAGRAVLSYILGAAGCLVILGMIYFTWAKYRRGERVCPGIKRKIKAKDVPRELVKSYRQPAPAPHNRQPTEVHVGRGPNPYAWPGQQTVSKHTAMEESYGLQNLNKPLPQRRGNDHRYRPDELRRPAPVARPGTPVSAIYPNGDGFYTVPVHGSPDHVHQYRY